MGLIHRAGDVWADLRPHIVAETLCGKAVLWFSWSSTVQIFANVDGVLARTRHGSPRTPHLWDGWPLLVEEPFFATACGCGDGQGYRSTPPLLVAVIEQPTDVTPLLDDAMRHARQLADDGYGLADVPACHPQQPCGAMSCSQPSTPPTPTTP